MSNTKNDTSSGPVRRVRDYENNLVDRSTVTKCYNGIYYPNETIVNVLNMKNYSHSSMHICAASKLQPGIEFVAISVNRDYHITTIMGITTDNTMMITTVDLIDKSSGPHKLLIAVEGNEKFTDDLVYEEVKSIVKYKYILAMYGTSSYAISGIFSTTNYLDRLKEYGLIHYRNEHIIYAVNSSTVDMNSLVENPNTGEFIPKELAPKEFKITAIYNKFNSIKTIKSVKYGTISDKTNFFEGNSTTFGVEIETCVGRIPDRLIKEHNWECVYDGSLKDDSGAARGGEYVTGILQGDAGIDELQKICVTLQKYTRINNKCSVHVHVNIDKKPSTIVALYHLALKLEDELFAMMPPSRKTSLHCQSIKFFEKNQSLGVYDIKSKAEYKIKLLQSYRHLYNCIAVKNISAKENIKDLILANKKHPFGDKCSYKKDTPRYWWLNFVPSLFARDTVSPKQLAGTEKYTDYTIEFRQHSASLNFNKIAYWVKICMAFVQFAKDMPYIAITDNSITLADVLKHSYPQSHMEVLNYVKERTEKFKEINEKAKEDELSEYIVINQEFKPIYIY